MPQNLPGSEVTTMVRSSSVRIPRWKPQSASVRVIFNFIDRSWPCLLNTLCSFSSKTTTMSPVSRPGSWSPSPEKRICCPSFIPIYNINKIDIQGLVLQNKAGHAFMSGLDLEQNLNGSILSGMHCISYISTAMNLFLVMCMHHIIIHFLVFVTAINLFLGSCMYHMIIHFRLSNGFI